MYLTRKHLSRRTLLRGAGVSVGLPLLDAMIPAATALAKTDAAPKLRAGFFYIPHGAVMWNTKHGKAMDRWTPSGAGADFKLSPILEPLEKHKHAVISFSNLENKASVASVHKYNPATWLSGVKPDLKAPGPSMSARPVPACLRRSTRSLPGASVRRQRCRRWRSARRVKPRRSRARLDSAASTAPRCRTGMQTRLCRWSPTRAKFSHSYSVKALQRKSAWP